MYVDFDRTLEVPMRVVAIALVIASACIGSAAQAQPSAACQQEARRQGLGGEALTAFMKRCSAGQVPAPPPARVTTPPADPPKASRPAARDDGRWYLQRPTSY